jgi:dTDP-4-dehydrorhamnose 3,5-epimerase
VELLSTPIDGVVELRIEPHSDERGAFARFYCKDAFAAAGIAMDVIQANISSNLIAGTLRGLHFQTAPFGEPKIVFCRKGLVWDVAVDVRVGSPTFGHWSALEMSAKNGIGCYLAAGIAHGFITLEDDSEVTYLMGASYRADSASGIRWNDSAIGIAWPMAPVVISDKDRSLPLLADHPTAYY